MGILKKIFHHIKNGSLIMTIRRIMYAKRHLVKKNLNKEEYLIGLGKLTCGYKMNLKYPSTLNEKLNYYKLHYNNPLMKKVVDKIDAKTYVKSKGLDDIIIKTIEIYNNANEINLDSLPNEFVIKNTQDSGGVFVCRDKTKISRKDVLNKLKDKYGFMTINGNSWALEPVYENENRIIVEELLKSNDGHAPADYKFFCFDGEPKFLFVGTERETEVKFDFFDSSFNWIDVRQGHKNNINRPNKPKNFDRMLEIVRILSKDFPHVRVDLYNIDGKIYFGELTFYHFAALTPFDPYKFDVEFGKFFNIDSIKNSEYYVE